MDDNGRIARVLMDWCARRQRGESPRPEDVLPDDADPADALPHRLAALHALENAFAESAELPDGPPEQIGEYRIVREIGRGGMGVVYEAEQPALNRRVALKLLVPMFTGSANAVKRFKREAQAAALLHHTNVVPIYDLGKHDRYWYYTMELVEGGPLTRWIEDHGRGPTNGAGRHFRGVAEMFAGVADALEASHRAGIIHRDVKPGNLMLAADGTLKILDFGVARLDEAPSMTVSGELVGTPAYMSPEQARAHAPDVDHRTDVYSLGATLYEAVTLAPPFEGTTAVELRAEILDRDPHRPRQANRRIPKDLETIVMKAMEKDRRYRYASADEMKRDLLRFVDGVPVRARPVGPVIRAWRHAKRHKIRSALTATILVLAAVAVFLGVRSVQEAAQRRASEYRMLLIDAQRMTPASLAQAARGTCAGPGSADSAASLLSEAIALVPERAEAYWIRALFPGRTADERRRDVEAAAARGLDEETVRLLSHHLTQIGQVYGSGDEEALPAGLPTSAVACYVKARLHQFQSDEPRALPLLERAISTTFRGSLVDAYARRARARALEALGHHRQALEDRLALKALGDGSYQTMLAIGRLYQAAGQDAAARQHLAAFVRDLPSATAPDLRARADALRMLGDLDAALAACTKSLEVDASSDNATRTHYLRAWIFKEKGDLASGLAACDDLLAATEWFGGLVERSRLLRKLDRPEEALRDARRARELFPGHEEPHNHEALALWALERHDEALAAFERVLALAPGRADAHHNAGRILMKQKNDPAKALEHFDAVTRLAPEDKVGWRSRGIALTRLGRRQEALASFDRVIELDADDARTWYERGVALTSLEDYPAARSSFERAIELDPEYADAHANLGALLHDRLRKPAAALEAFEAALALEQSAMNWANKGIALRSLRRHREAARAFRNAIECDETHAKSYRALSRLLYQHLRQPARALEYADRLCRLRPDDPRSWHCRAWAAFRAKRPEEVVRSLERRAKLAPPLYAGDHQMHGRALLDLGRVDDALEALTRAAELKPDIVQYACWKADVLTMLGRLDEALESYRVAARLDARHPFARRNVAGTLRLLGRWAESIEAADDGLTELQGDAALLVTKGKSLRALGRDREALAAFAGASSSVAKLEHRLQKLLVERREDLDAIVDGDREAATLDERVIAARLAAREGRPARAVALWEAMFVAEPRLTWDCAEEAARAALAAAEAARDGEANALRAKPLEWMETKLDRKRSAIEDGKTDAARNSTRMQLGDWLGDPAFAPVRDPAHLAALPEEEREAWTQFWDDVRAAIRLRGE